MSNSQRILAGILGLQIVLAAVVYWPRNKAAGTGGLLLEDLQRDQIVRLAITDDEGQFIDLKKINGDWILANAGNYPAQGDKISPVLEKLTSIRSNRLITQTAASHDRLQVAEDNFQRKIDIESSDGSTRTLFIGSSGGVLATHVRLAGQDQVYLTSEISSFDVRTDASNWIDTSYVKVPKENLAAMVLENANGKFVFSQDQEGAWTMEGLQEGEQFNANNLTSLVNRIVSLPMTRPLGTEALPGYGLEEPNAVIEFTVVDQNNASAIQRLEIGAENADGKTYFVKYSESDYYVEASSATLNDFIHRTRQEFIQQPATETPAS